jgi:hypothetical protein
MPLDPGFNGVLDKEVDGDSSLPAQIEANPILGVGATHAKGATTSPAVELATDISHIRRRDGSSRCAPLLDIPCDQEAVGASACQKAALLPSMASSTLSDDDW